MAVAHLTLDFSAGHHGRNGVDDNRVDGTGTDESLTNLHGLLTGVGLADQQTVNVNAQRGGIGRV